MIDRNQRDALILKINDIKNVFVQLNKPQYMFDFSVCQMKMEELIKNFQEQFSPEKAGEYTEVLQGIQLALLQINNQHNVNHAEIDEMVTLCIELTDYLIKKLQAEKEVKKEVYFLPYKLDMWDSLESIWQVLNEDEHFNAYVMPIPWAERNVDTSAKEWHFELQEFSKYVPVVDYRNVDLAAVRPDVIFIHNPYDGENIATSVDMHFYSDKLKKCTDTLIYVPYFVVGDKINPDKCQAPAIHYADYVIVQDENIKKQYEENYLWGDPNGKFLPFGSPKFDKVLSTSRQDYTLPAEWEQKIKGKKVILYNTSINDMMRYDEYYIAKLKSVFAYFKDRDDATLWWRPHPLLKTSMSVVRPEFYVDYCKLEQEFKNNKWGIYDDSFDVHRAIACTDAYYGDHSSLVWLYKLTGKHVMLQDYKKIYYTFKPQLETNFLASDGKGNYWGTQCINGYQILFYLDSETGMVTILEELPNSFSKKWAYGTLAYYKNKIIIVPWYEKVPVLVYDLKRKEFSVVDCLSLNIRKEIGRYFLEIGIENESAIYFVSASLEIILEFSKDKEQFKAVPLHIENHIAEWCCIKDKVILLASKNELGILNTIDWSIRWEKLPYGKEIWRMNWIDDIVWIVCYGGNEVVIYDMVERKYHFSRFQKPNKIERPFWGVVNNGGAALLLPGGMSTLGTCIKMGEDVVIESKEISIDNNQKDFTSEYITAVVEKQSEWIATLADGESFLVGRKDGLYRKMIKFVYDDWFYMHMHVGYKLLNNCNVNEDDPGCLLNYLNCSNKKNQTGKKIECGKAITEFLTEISD